MTHPLPEGIIKQSIQPDAFEADLIFKWDSQIGKGLDSSYISVVVLVEIRSIFLRMDIGWRQGFDIQCEGFDDATGEKEYTMLWQQK